MADTRDKGLVEKETALIAEIERLLPDFARSCRDSTDVVIIHQDSFAADYQDEEYALKRGAFITRLASLPNGYGGSSRLRSRLG